MNPYDHMEAENDILRAKNAELKDILKTILKHEEGNWPCSLANCPKCAAYERADAIVNPSGDQK